MLRCLLIVVALLGCETEVRTVIADPRQGTADASTSSDAGGAFSYPVGPYGTGVGGTLAPLEFVTPADELWSFDADVFQDPDAKVMLLTTTAGWCTACLEEQPVLNELHAEYAADGLRVVVSIFEDSSFSPATAEDALGWQTRHQLEPAVVADPEFVLAAYYDRSVTPMNMLVTVGSMKIIYLETGFDEDEIRELLESLL